MRKKEVVRVPPGFGRDSEKGGKVFLLTEWPADRAEKWAISALLAYNRGGGEFPQNVIGAGMEGIFFIGVQTFLRGQIRADEVIPILDELFECVKIIRDPKARDQTTGDVVATPLVGADDIEEVKTRMWLRSEVLRVHTGFSLGDALSSLISAIMTKTAPPLNTQMSQE